jgi:hypothetical protein
LKNWGVTARDGKARVEEQEQEGLMRRTGLCCSVATKYGNVAMARALAGLDCELVWRSAEW